MTIAATAPTTAVVDVVIATYQGAATLGATITSILEQGPFVRVHVVDDGSTDDTATLVAHLCALYPDRLLYRWQPNGGRLGPPPRNAALPAVTAPYVLFFDADDLLEPGVLGPAIRTLEAHPTWGALVHDYRNFTTDADFAVTHFATCPRLGAFLRAQHAAALRSEAVELPRQEAKRILTEENFVITGSVLYRTATVRALGGFDPAIARGEDFALLWRALSAGPVGLTTRVAFRRRLHEGNLSRDAEAMLTGKVAGRKRLLAEETDPTVRRALRACLARTLDELAALRMEYSRRAGCRTALASALLGWNSGVWPRAGGRALVRSCLPEAALTVARRWRGDSPASDVSGRPARAESQADGGST